MKELNYRLNELYSETLENYYSVCALTLETTNMVPPKFVDKIDKELFKELLKKKWKHCKKVYKYEQKVARRTERKEKRKAFRFKIKIILKRLFSKKRKDTPSLVKESNDNNKGNL